MADPGLLLQAWECLKGLHAEDFPAEIRPAFNFLQHEIARARREELSAREIGFLAGKIRKLEAMGSGTLHESTDPPA